MMHDTTNHTPTAVTLTPEQIDEIADRAACKAIAQITDHIYKEIGRGVINKLLWVVGVVATGMYFWLHDKINIK